MKTVQFFLMVLVAFPAGASSKVDSLKQVLETHTAIDKADVLWRIAYELFDVDNPQALFYAERAHHEVWRRGDSLQIVKVGTTYGQLLRRVGQVDRSIEVSSSLLPVARRNKHKKYVKMLLNSLGGSYTFKEDFAKALELFYETMHLRELEKDSVGIPLSLLNIGFILYKTNDYRASLQYSTKAYELAKRDSLNDILTDACFNIGSAYAGMNRHDSARYFYCMSLGLASKFQRNDILAQYYQSYAHTLLEMKNLDSAKYYAALAVSLGRPQSNIWPVSMAYNLLSRIALLEGNVDLSWKYMLKIDSMNSSNSYPFIKLQAIKQKSRYYSVIGDPSKSLKYLDRYYAMTDSLYRGKEREKIRVLQVAFEERINRQKIKAQAEVLELQSLAISKKEKFIIIVSLLLAVVGVLTISLYRSNRRAYIINQMLDDRVARRTKELMLQRDDLIHNREEERISKQKIFGEIKGSINSLNGIVHLMRVDKNGNTDAYLEQAAMALSRIEETARRLTIEYKNPLP